jgi:hypothetical protein
MLSSNSIEQLVAVSAFVPHRGDTRRRDDVRQVVQAAGEELGLDARQPPLPDFAGGEDVLAAAVRVLKLTKAEKELEKHRARVAASREDVERIGELYARGRELRRAEVARRSDAIMAGRLPGPPPADAVAELAAIDAELALGGDGSEAVTLPPERAVVLEAVAAPTVFASVVFYAALVVDLLLALTQDEQYNSAAAKTTQRAVAELRHLAHRFEYRKADFELHRTLLMIGKTVDLAELHPRERHELTVEDLVAARAGR